MKKIHTIAIILALILFTTSVNASILGPEITDGYTINIGHGTTSSHYTWYSDQEGVGKQTENYITYYPNDYVEPLLTHGKYLYGGDTISNEAKSLKNNGYIPIAGINADFFSLDSGIPMSNIITDGKIITKTGSQQYGVGILEDNTAFMSNFILYSIMRKNDGSVINIPMINKYRQPYSIYMLTDDFSSETHNKTEGIDVILGSIEGEISIGKEITATVESIEINKGSIPIPEGKIILTVDSKASEELLTPITSLEVGEEINIRFSLEGDERFAKSKIILGATGDVLIEKGELKSNFQAGAHPRTAIGITSDGGIIFYTIDGRQKGYSYGVQLKSLAKRMQELGCIDAINLDGGGSTSYIVQFPGDDYNTLVNKPSDGYLRSVGNFLFLTNLQKPTGILKEIYVYPLTAYVLKNSTIKLSAKGIDSAFHPVNLNNLTYYTDADCESIITENGEFIAKDNKAVTIYAKSGNITGKTKILSIAKPTDIKIKDKNGNYIDKISIDRKTSVSYTAEPYYIHNLLQTNDGEIKWSCDSNIGSITQKGVFTSSDVIEDTTGNIYITAGETTKEIPVTVKGLDEYYNNIELNQNDNYIEIKLNTNYASIAKEDIIIKINGKKTDFEYNEGIARLYTNEDISKITVFATNYLGYSSFSSWDLLNKSFDNPFSDTKEHWAKDILSYMHNSKIINGEMAENKLIYNPDKSMTRSEFASMISNYLDINVNDYKNVILPYEDTNRIPDWAINYFRALYELKIITGSSSNGLLYANPNDKITREEAVTIISRTLPKGLKKVKITSTDLNDISSWANDGFEILTNLGAIKGYEDGTLLPKKNVTKAEAAKILYTIS